MKPVPLLALSFAALFTSVALAKERSESKVKIESSHVTDAGKTVVVFKLTVSPKWHLYANPANNKEVVDQQLVVTSSVPAKIVYPAGTPYTDTHGDKFLIYEKTIEVRAVLERPIGEANPEFTFKLQVCSDKDECLLPSTVKLMVK